ncbi:unnamed protein product [Rhizoctonia solani]|uniref:Uncharacterized protein n=1 Tax=Rhizoctonia solani TaxID=456999 RepID=A0A8H3CJQ1_9AGAM|nr:unnamed protein product [Rhizoctonia solani]
MSVGQPLSQPLRYFNTISTLPQDHKEAAGHLVSFFSPHVDELSTGVKQLNWTSLKNSVDAYPGIELVIEGYRAPGASATTFKDLPDCSTAAIRDPLSVPIPSNFSSILSTVFSDLKYAKQAGWADFKHCDSPTQYDWEYRLLTMIPNPSVSDDFIASLATIQFGSQTIVNESQWYETNQLYSTDITLNPTTMKLVVNKGFKVSIPDDSES